MNMIYSSEKKSMFLTAYIKHMYHVRCDSYWWKLSNLLIISFVLFQYLAEY